MQPLSFLAHKLKLNVRLKGRKQIIQLIQVLNYFIKRMLHSSRYNRTKIRWSKNSKFLGKAKNIKISKKGALRILDVTYRDSGIYACHAGLSLSELKLKVKPKPGDREPTEADYESVEDESENEAIG